MRPAFAFLISPLPAVALLLLLDVRIIGNRAPISALVLFYSMLFVPQLVLAVPLRWLLARRGWQSLWIDAATGSLASFLPAIVYFALSHPRAQALALAGVLVVLTLQGMVTGVTYGLLRLRDRRATQAITPADLADRFS